MESPYCLRLSSRSSLRNTLESNAEELFGSMVGYLGADRFLAMNNGYILPKREDRTKIAFASGGLPARKGPRPITTAGPLQIQCNGLGDSKYLNRLLNGRGRGRAFGELRQSPLHVIRVPLSFCTRRRPDGVSYRATANRRGTRILRERFSPPTGGLIHNRLLSNMLSLSKTNLARRSLNSISSLLAGLKFKE